MRFLKQLDSAIGTLRKGGIIIIPTDTVLGFATDPYNISPQRKIYRLKKRSYNKPLILFVGTTEEVKKFISNRITELRTRIIENFWPGPLTLIFKAKRGKNYLWNYKDRVAIRIPNHPVVHYLTRKYGPLATTSANVSKEGALSNYREAGNKFGKKVDYVVKENAYGGLPSTILDVSHYPFTLLRKGPISVVDIEDILLRKIKIKRNIPFHILFICTGNTCRSPMAMGLMRKYIPRSLMSVVRIKSRGTDVHRRATISYETNHILREMGINLAFHRARQVDPGTLEWADIILVMERYHYLKLTEMGFGDKVRLIGSYAKNPYAIPDPAGRNLNMYYRVKELLEKPIKKIVKDLKYRYEVS